ncbi:efflux RND transporter periplasmic adaptor subunit [Xanthomonas arboricola pv. juglandis]|uniref:efflux RND transporter periplasmic adaptor subunit n=1 Tax=Xanthomonas arboricola TaxID=56448 RepID=UPI0004749EDA|nr:efflux RND transporter periplasmic adaptor subunit [Xanthomonas arboricola]MDN0222589.1 efflux RND transporter periplasmic adaptor subunit [Xanthomonas arboricola pv. juglandis]MDN0226044.1 efflux RND transporter periplasmic adaptor subunit [Xanthomonas arboricola pv. juglandis]MDN0230315.1 efflux RND transporter periplasmic adaptor subunit [Xanthomonas arboricola pv. juglandis]MDN0235455.1 efflux RND transporter periplasmic adaptor subunit [Xanthomonas arboricola pv. juglandis]MDN0239701.1
MLRRLVNSAAFCVLPLALIACGKAPPSDPRTEAPLVRVAIVEDAGAAARSFSGTVAARVQSDLGFRVAGKVQERLVDAGQRVKRGQPLLRIDPVDLKLAARAQQEAVAAAQARAQQAGEDEARYRDLRGTGAISASAYDQIKAAADTARAQLGAAQAQAEVARNANRYTDLLADADGVVMETLVEPGQVVAAGQPVVRLAHAGRREAVIQLPETLRPQVGSVAQATLFGNAAVTVPATLRQLSESADRLTRTFEARYVLDGALGDAPLGTTVSLRIADGTAAGTQAGLQVPLAALFDAGKGPGVWVIAGNPAKVRWRPVTVLGLDDDHATVAGKLARGERIVALGAHLLRDGEQVRVVNTIAPAAGSTTGAKAAAAAGAQP